MSEARGSILLVDDEANILEVFSTELAAAGFDVRTASRADEALRQVAEAPFDVALIDQFLGPDRGLDLMGRMQERDPRLSFVIMTANGSADLATVALKTGAADFVSKPFRTSDLVRSVEYVLKKRDLDRQKGELVAALERQVNDKTDELRRVYVHVLETLAQAMEKRDMGTYGHSRRVAYTSRLIATALNLDDGEKNSLKTAALLHDIGKIGISDFILGKKGPLTGDELRDIRSHPRKGVEILQPLRNFEAILPAILHHHERFDGTGYPDGLRGEQIPLHARIIAVADTYDAILANRPYRNGSTHERAMQELQDCAGRQFDPRIVAAFAETDRRYRSVVDPLSTREGFSLTEGFTF